jgi:hypothetical protein
MAKWLVTPSISAHFWADCRTGRGRESSFPSLSFCILLVVDIIDRFYGNYWADLSGLFGSLALVCFLDAEHHFIGGGICFSFNGMV